MRQLKRYSIRRITNNHTATITTTPKKPVSALKRASYKPIATIAE